ncbi:pheophytinase, chloroplastic [Tanacetum coccineum]
MEILSGHSAPCSRITPSRRKFPERNLGSIPSNFSRRRKYQDVCGLVRSKVWCSHNIRKLMTISAIKGVEGVIDVEESLEKVTKRRGSIPKVLVPGLPDESKGDVSAPVTTGRWEWKPKFNIHYERSGSRNVNAPQVLFLPGFGVGSFHYEKQLKDLGRDYGVWAIDFLGQGMSLPHEDPTRRQQNDGESQVEDHLWGFGDETEPWADDLVYSIDLWQDQVRYFIEEVIKEPVYIVGNSLGGYVALYFAACNPNLVKGVTLLNATPFWGFFPNPERSPVLSQMFPSAGNFPLSPRVRKIVEIVWEKMRDPRSIGEILKQVYADHSTNIDKVFSRILEVTEHPAALASFASIMLAPQGKVSFGEALFRCKIHDIPICLMYGKEDPWVRPIWGLQVKKQLPEAPYYQISPAGHCPHDEVPEVVNYLLRGWIKNLESKGFVALPLLDDESGRYDVAKDLEFVRDGAKRSVRVLFHGSESAIWSRLSYFFSNQLENLTIKFR